MKKVIKSLIFTLAMLMIFTVVHFGTENLSAFEHTIPEEYTVSGSQILNSHLIFTNKNNNGDGGRFVLYTASGQRLLYDCSSRAVIQIGSKNFYFTPTATYINADKTKMYSYMIYNDVLIERYCQFTYNTMTDKYDTMEMKFVFTNKSASAVSAGVRIMFII